jgi:hypothetical protein
MHAVECLTTVADFLTRSHAMFSTILAVDLGKYNPVLCRYEPAPMFAWL